MTIKAPKCIVESGDSYNKDLFNDQLERRLNDLKRTILSNVRSLGNSDFDYIQKEYGVDNMVGALIHLAYVDVAPSIKKTVMKLKRDGIKSKMSF